jgi:Rod binding domain-containing protein
MVTNTLADSISRSGSFGLARSLAKQLQHEFKTDRAELQPGQGNSREVSQASSATPFPLSHPRALLGTSLNAIAKISSLQSGQVGSTVH